MEERCGNCKNWKYTDWIERKYGEGTGLCKYCSTEEPKGCDHAACLLYEKTNER